MAWSSIYPQPRELRCWWKRNCGFIRINRIQQWHAECSFPITNRKKNLLISWNWSFFYQTWNNLIVHHICSAKRVCRRESFCILSYTRISIWRSSARVLVLVKTQNRQHPEYWVRNTWEQKGGLNSHQTVPRNNLHKIWALKLRDPRS